MGPDPAKSPVICDSPETAYTGLHRPGAVRPLRGFRHAAWTRISACAGSRICSSVARRAVWEPSVKAERRRSRLGRKPVVSPWKFLAEGEEILGAASGRMADQAGGDAATGVVDASRAAEDRQVIDEDHLRRMTLGDRRLEREVLQIFVRQTVAMLERIGGGEPVLAAAAAHTLAGSARGIGAWRLASAAERFERASAEGSEETLSEAMAELKAASLEASAAIGARLATSAN
jgi:HPt (histidine-containing phosphotransfer) domain-containing protein